MRRRGDAAALDRVFHTSFCDTFAHLYRPEDLAAFLGQFTPEAWAERDRTIRAMRFRIAEVDGELVGYRQARPDRSLPVETDAPGASNSARSTSSRTITARGIAAGADGLGARRGAAARRSRSST